MLEFKDLPTVNSERWFSLENLPGEAWKDIEGYEGKYQISLYGRVKSLKRMRRNGRGLCRVEEKIMKPTWMKTHSGYWYVTLITEDIKHKKHFIHRLVAEHFIPNTSGLPCVNHKDENTSNNSIGNLEWCTYAYNNAYGTALERSRRTRDYKGISKAVEKRVGKEITRYRSLGEASKDNNVDKGTLSYYCRNGKIFHGAIYKYVDKMNKMTLSKEGENLIKRFEGFRSKAYKPVPTEKHYTIAWGHYGPDVKQGMTITEEQGQELFRKDIKPIECVLNSLGINFPQEIFDSLCSWIYNLGLGNFNSSTLKKKILADADDIDITDQMVRWCNAGGKPMLGLKRRRVAEANMFVGYELYYLDDKNNIKKK